MDARSRFPAALALLLAIVSSSRSEAERISLVPRYQPGDAYALALETKTDTHARARGPGAQSSSENVLLQYSAMVTILETDPAGRSLRERHDAVKLGYERPEGTGSLFRAGASFEVRRDEQGRVQLFVGDERIERRLERIVGELLEAQFEYGPEAALIDPGREVEVGESWPLEAGRVRRLLRERGVEAIELAGPAEARLERDADGALVVAYAIPIEWLEIDGMPANSQAARSAGRYEGRVRLSAERHQGPASHASSLTLQMNGVVTKPGVARSFPWSLESARVASQRNRPLERISGL